MNDRHSIESIDEIIDSTQMAAKSIVTQPSNSPPANQRGSANLFDLDPALAIPNLIMLSMVAIAIYASIPNRKGRSSIATPPSGIVCRRCEYFSDNHYVKCALHPTTVMTERAIDCQDCHLKQEAEWVKKMKNILPSIYNFFTK